MELRGEVPIQLTPRYYMDYRLLVLIATSTYVDCTYSNFTVFFFFLLRSTDGHGGACSFFAFFQEKVDQGKDVVTKWRVVME